MNWSNRRENVEYLKRLYPEGTRIRLDYMADSRGVPAGTEGTVLTVDSIGQIHMKWDNGRTLALVPETDSFSIISAKEEMTMSMGGM